MELSENKLELNPHDIREILERGANASGLVSIIDLDITEEKWVNGRFDLFNYKNIAYVGVKDLQIIKPFTSKTHLEDMISFEIMLKGGSDMQLGEQHILNNDMPRLVVSSHHKNSQQSRFHKAKENYKGVGVWISPANFQTLFQLDYSKFPDSIGEILQSNINHSLIYPVTSEMRNVVEDVIENPYENIFKNHYTDAKVTELLCIIIQCITSPELAFNQKNQLSSSKANAMKLLLSTIDINLALMPSLNELAITIGMSKGQLSKTFKLSYGMTITEYITQKRLMRAQELVNEGKLSVLQIALEVGYTNQSSFGRAFKNFYGYSPLKNTN
mgnify:CR=1 FL=1